MIVYVYIYIYIPMDQGAGLRDAGCRGEGGGVLPPRGGHIK